MPLHELLQQLITYLRGMWRYRWYSMVVAWLVALFGWYFVMQMPDTYLASARVNVDTETMLRPLLRGLTVQSDVTQRIALMTNKLLSRPILEKVARKTDLDLQANDSTTLDALVQKLRASVSLSATKRSNIYTITAKYDDPRMARDIVQALVTIFVEDSLGEGRNSTASAQDFLRTQIKDYENKLREAEARIKDFKQQYMGKLPGTGRDYFDKLQAAKQQSETAKLQLREIENRRDEIKRQMLGEEPVFGVASDISDDTQHHPLDSRIDAMQAELNGLLLQYTAEHPKIIAITETIAIMQEKRRKDLAAMPTQPKSSNLNQNPVYQQLKIAYGQAEAEASALMVRVKEYNTRVEELAKLANTIPEIEAKLTDMNRDYSLHKTNYDTLLSRLESAMLSEKADKTGEDVKFEVIEPPRIPTQPSGPNRVLFGCMALFGGVLVGLLVAFLLSQFRPAFYDQRTLRQVTGLPVFGSVSRIWTPQLLMKKRVELGGFLSVGLLLGVTFMGFLFMSQSDPELVSQVVNTVRSISQ